MSYLERCLQPGESLLATRRLHWVIYLWPVVLMVAGAGLAAWTALASPRASTIFLAVAGVLLAAGILTFLQKALVGWSTEYAVTDHRLLVKRGLLSVHTVEMSLDKIESVDVDQSLIGRMLGYGAVTVHGVGSRWDPITLIPDPSAFRNAISSAPRP
jgi:uncharacterized membrane protein YdbT with pleckstrin-like domain